MTGLSRFPGRKPPWQAVHRLAAPRLTGLDDHAGGFERPGGPVRPGTNITYAEIGGAIGGPAVAMGPILDGIRALYLFNGGDRTKPGPTGCIVRKDTGQPGSGAGPNMGRRGQRLAATLAEMMRTKRTGPRAR